jgi:hypothetical protein
MSSPSQHAVNGGVSATSEPKRGDAMSDTQEAAPGGPGDARITEEHDIAGPPGEAETEATDDGGRRWYHLRPKPRRRADLMGFNSTLWMVVVWIIVIVVAVFPFPWWW